MGTMNILYFHVHDQGRYVSTYGYPPQTPHLTRLAERGVLFRNAFCAAPTCSPSRAALLTGTYPHQNGMYGLTNQGWQLNDYDRHLRRFLADQGYETVLVGSHHVTEFTPEGLDRLGYDQRFDRAGEDSRAEFRTEEAIRYLREPREKPFFMALGYDITHRSKWNRSFVHSFESRGPLDDAHVRPYEGLPDTPETRLEAALQVRATEFQDDQLGRILDVLEELGIAEETLVIYTTDHGPGLPYAKKHLNDRGTGVSLVVAGPGGFAGGRVIDGLVSHLDVFPTLCELLGAEPGHRLEGRSLLPLVRGDTESVRDAIFAEQNYHGAYCPFRSVRTERYRYIRKIGGVRLTVDSNTADAGDARAVLKAHGSAEREMPDEELYDLVFDPGEWQNLAGDPAHGDVLEDMRKRLDAWMRETDDPALTNSVPESPQRPAWAKSDGALKRQMTEAWTAARDRLMGR